MTRRWLRHPAQTIGPPPPCPAGPRYRTQDLARAALGLNHSTLTAQYCPACTGWHIQEQQ